MYIYEVFLLGFVVNPHGCLGPWPQTLIIKKMITYVNIDIFTSDI